MTPVTVRFTPTTDEMARIAADLTRLRSAISMKWAIALAIPFILQGLLNLAAHRPGPTQWLGYAQLIIGVLYVPLIRRRRSSYAILKKPVETALKIDDCGILISEPSSARAAWKRVVAIRDVGEAFVIFRRYGKPLLLLKRAMPDDGTSLWSAFETKLMGARYLVRGSDTRRTITNTAARH